MKHAGDHQLEILCLKCVMADIMHQEALTSLVKDFVKVLDNIEIQPNSALHHCAKNLLNEIETI